LIRNTLTVTVTFTVTTKEKLVILEVDSNNSELESFIRGQLNHKKVSLKVVKNGIV